MKGAASGVTVVPRQHARGTREAAILSNGGHELDLCEAVEPDEQDEECAQSELPFGTQFIERSGAHSRLAFR